MRDGMWNQPPGGETLEVQLHDAFAKSPSLQFDAVSAIIHRFLQLARREGYKTGFNAARPEVTWATAADLQTYAATEYPFPPVTREVPRVEPDPHVPGTWHVAVDGVLRYQVNDRTEFIHSFLARKPATPERCELWASLLRTPTRTETVEE